MFRAAAVCIALFGGTLHAFASGPATTTTLTFIANGSPVTTLVQGNAITLSATVSSGGTPLTVGQVEFCDSSPYCTDIHQLALAQLTSAGTATFRFVPRAGTQHYKAVFLGTNNYAASNSGAQALTVTPSGYNYVSSSTLVASGSPGNYTLTDTVTGGGDTAAPTGTVSFLDTNNANYVLGTATLVPLVGQFSFVNSANLSPNSGQSGQPVADFNGDGIPDVAIAASAINTPPGITILLGNGDGTFTQSQAIPLPYYFDKVEVADFNGDGIADLVLAEFMQFENPVSTGYFYQIALGNGDGTFTLLPPVLLPTVPQVY